SFPKHGKSFQFLQNERKQQIMSTLVNRKSLQNNDFSLREDIITIEDESSDDSLKYSQKSDRFKSKIRSKNTNLSINFIDLSKIEETKNIWKSKPKLPNCTKIEKREKRIKKYYKNPSNRPFDRSDLLSCKKCHSVLHSSRFCGEKKAKNFCVQCGKETAKTNARGSCKNCVNEKFLEIRNSDLTNFFPKIFPNLTRKFSNCCNCGKKGHIHKNCSEKKLSPKVIKEGLRAKAHLAKKRKNKIAKSGFRRRMFPIKSKKY
ncbi:hypothetical protein MHBO_002703, partial [Bonamia ostreae]